MFFCYVVSDVFVLFYLKTLSKVTNINNMLTAGTESFDVAGRLTSNVGEGFV